MNPDVDIMDEPKLAFDGEAIKSFTVKDENTGTELPFFEKEQHEKIDKLLDKYKGEGGHAKLIKSYMELEGKQGKAIKPLDKNATDRDIADRRKMIANLLNVPETADKYELVDPQQDLPQGMVVNEDLKNELKLIAHKHNVPPEALQAVYEMHNKSVINSYIQRQKALADAQKNTLLRLKAELGADRTQKAMELARRLLKGYTKTDEEWEQEQVGLGENGLGDNYTVARAIMELAELKLSEGSTLNDGIIRKQNTKSLREKHFPNSPSMD